MNKYLEYLKLIPKGLKNPLKIMDGIYNEIKLENNSLEEEELQEILKRRLICQSCPFYSLNATTSEEYYNIFEEHYKTDRKDTHCSICSCNERIKTASLESDCGLNTNIKTLYLPLKWTKFNKTN